MVQAPTTTRNPHARQRGAAESSLGACAYIRQF
jgi:hypothetical protein